MGEVVVEFTISAESGESVKVEAENWMTAMGKALGFFDLDIHSVTRLSISPARDGSVFIDDPVGGRSWLVRSVAPEIAVRATGRSPTEKWEVTRKMNNSVPPRAPERGASALPMPGSSSLVALSYLDRTELLRGSMARTSRERACDSVLDAIDDYVHAEASSVAIGRLHDPALRFAAARGPRAAAVVGRQPGFGEGLVGMCFDMRGTLVVNDVAGDTPHLDQLDRRLPALAVLAVPLVDDDGEAHGVIQLINPPERPFSRTHVEVVEAFARVLAGNLAARTTV